MPESTPRLLSRRDLLKVGAAGLTLATGVISNNAPAQIKEERESSFLPEISQETAIKIVDREIERLQGTRNMEESTLWNETNSVWAKLSGEALSVANTRLLFLQQAMQESKIKPVKESMDFLKANGLRLIPVTALNVGGIERPAAIRSSYKTDGSVEVEINVSQRSTLINSMEENLLAIITETTLLRKRFEFMEQSSAPSKAEKYKEASERTSAPSQDVNLASEVLAAPIDTYFEYLLHAGKMNPQIKNKHAQEAAAWILAGRNHKDKRWINYIAKQVGVKFY